MNQYTTPRYELIRDYQEKCAALEEDMLGWKERAEAAEARAERLRVALEVIASDPTNSAQAMVARKALEDDKQ